VAAEPAAFVTQTASSSARSKKVVLRAKNQERFVMRRNLGLVLVASALVALFFLALAVARAQGHLPVLALDFTEHLFGIVLAVFIFERMLAWREARQWLAAKDWLYLILLETVDDLLKGLLPATVPREEEGTDEKTAVYEVTGELIHVGETVRYSPLRLLVRPGEKDLQSHIFWYATELGPQRYVELAREALSDARSQIRDTFGSSARLMDADITTMLISFEQAAMAAIRHLDSAANMRNEKLEDASHGEASTTQRIREADNELAFVSSIIVESVVDSAMKPKAWLEDQRHTREGPSSPFRRLQASSRSATGPR
jgi:hypothetical protein